MLPLAGDVHRSTINRKPWSGRAPSDSRPNSVGSRSSSTSPAPHTALRSRTQKSRGDDGGGDDGGGDGNIEQVQASPLVATIIVHHRLSAVRRRWEWDRVTRHMFERPACWSDLRRLMWRPGKLRL